MPDLLLASASPRRRELLEQIGVQFKCAPQDLDESILSGESPRDYVARLATEKAASAVKESDIPVLGADTCVVLGGTILSKPEDKQAAFDMLSGLSGNVHEVLTGICLHPVAGAPITQVVSTQVRFISLSDKQIEQYIATGEPMDKAGAYGIQGKAAVFVESLSGSYSNVVGLPLTETAQLLQQHDVPIWCE